MKHFAPYALVWLLCMISLPGKAQLATNTKLFANAPDVINCQEADFNNIFAAQQGQNLSINFSGNFSFSGTVVGNTIADNGSLQTVTIRSAVLDNTILNISKRLDANRNTAYVGRIVNFKYLDGYELKRDATGQYQFTKMETNKVVQPCKQ